MIVDDENAARTRRHRFCEPAIVGDAHVLAGGRAHQHFVVQHLQSRQVFHPGDERDVVDGLREKVVGAAFEPLNRSDGWSSAVTMTTGRCCVAGSALIRRQASKPSMPGIMTSSRTTSTRSRARTSRASAPLMAVKHFKILGLTAGLRAASRWRECRRRRERGRSWVTLPARPLKNLPPGPSRGTVEPYRGRS